MSVFLCHSAQGQAKRVSGISGRLVIVSILPDTLQPETPVRLQLARLEGKSTVRLIGAKDIRALIDSGLQVDLGSHLGKIDSYDEDGIYVLIPRGLRSLPANRVSLVIDSIRSPPYGLTRNLRAAGHLVQAEPDSFYIRGVIPRLSYPESLVTVQLSRDPVSPADSADAGKVPNWLTVWIGGERADVLKHSGPTIIVRVPAGSPAGKSVEVTVDAGMTRTPSYFGLAVDGAPSLGTGKEPGGPFKNWGTWLAVVLAVVPALATYMLGQRRQVMLQKRLNDAYSEARSTAARAAGYVPPTPVTLPPEVEKPIEVPVPEAPVALVEACASGRCILVVGPGLGIAAGYPSWNEILQRIVAQTPDLIPTPRSSQPARGLSRSGQDLNALLADGREAAVTELLIARTNRDWMLNQVKSAYEALPQSISGIGTGSLLGDIPFENAVTTSWDNLLKETFAHRAPTIVYSSSVGGLSALLQEDKFCIVRLYGSPLEPATMVLTRGEYREMLAKNPSLGKHLASLLLSRTHLFVGMSPEDIETYFSDVVDSSRRDMVDSSRDSMQHFAYVPASAQIELDAERIESKYRTQLLPFTPGGKDRGQLLQGLQRLRDAVRPRLAEGVHPGRGQAVLQQVNLTNIGPFKDITLNLSGGWNVLLGNNGSGKSTLLKAIALGLCGDDKDAAFSGEQLLRADAPHGLIELYIGGVWYTTELVRSDGRVLVICRQLTPLLARQAVVLGFPPLRGIATGASPGPSADGSHEPVVQDLLPTLSAEPDRRLENLRQWIVNLEVRSKSGNGVTESQAKQNAALRRRFFSLLNAFTPGLDVEFEDVNMNSWVVRVRTADGKVPIEQLSQGMMSVYAWVGTLLQRMFEIYTDSPDPTQESALVLVDELDAHLHPEWQQQIVHLLKEHLHGLQVVATTHSPLIVAGMKADEVKIVARRYDDPSTIEIHPPPADFAGMRADQILTSPLFGLLTTRSEGTRVDIDRYSVLLGNLNRSPKEELEFTQLKTRLEPVLNVGETKLERRVEQAVEAALSELTPERLVTEATAQQAPHVALEIKRQLAEVFGRETPKRDLEAPKK